MSGGMFEVKIEGVKELKGYLEAQRTNQLPYAFAIGLNNVAFKIRTREIDLLTKVFDRPKPQTAKNVFVKKATKSVPRALVIHDQIFNKGIDEYMVANVEGGRRKMKPSEQRLGRFYVPGVGAKMDQYGNMQGGQITQILSRLGRFGDVAGYNMNQTAASMARRTGGKKSLEYFMITQRRGGLAPGIYQRVQSGAGFGGQTTKSMAAGSFQRGQKRGRFSSVIRGRGVIPVVLFLNKPPSYRPVWPFWRAAEEVIDTKLVPEMEKAIEHALRTAVRG